MGEERGPGKKKLREMGRTTHFEDSVSMFWDLGCADAGVVPGETHI